MSEFMVVCTFKPGTDMKDVMAGVGARRATRAEPVWQPPTQPSWLRSQAVRAAEQVRHFAQVRLVQHQHHHA